jgi:hypothetical protein
MAYSAFGQAAGLAEDHVGDPDLPDVVESAGHIDRLELRGGQPQASPDERRVTSHVSECRLV